MGVQFKGGVKSLSMLSRVLAHVHIATTHVVSILSR